MTLSINNELQGRECCAEGLMMDNKEGSSFDSLPDDLIREIFSYLEREDLKNDYHRVCLRWSHLSKRLLLSKELLKSQVFKKPTYELKRVRHDANKMDQALTKLGKQSDKKKPTEPKKVISRQEGLAELKRLIAAYPATDNLSLCVDLSEIDDEALKEITLNLAYLRRFQLKNFSFGEKFNNITDKGLKGITILHPELEHLSIGRCKRISAKGVVEMLKYVKGLKSLIINDHRLLSGQLVEYVGDRFYRSIEKLLIDGSPGSLTESSIDALLRCRNSLTSLELTSLGLLLTPQQLYRLLKGLPRLKELVLTMGEDLIDSQAVRVIFASPLPSLEKLTIRNAQNVKREVLDCLNKALPNLNSLSMAHLKHPTRMEKAFDRCKKKKHDFPHVIFHHFINM